MGIERQLRSLVAEFARVVGAPHVVVRILGCAADPLSVTQRAPGAPGVISGKRGRPAGGGCLRLLRAGCRRLAWLGAGRWRFRRRRSGGWRLRRQRAGGWRLGWLRAGRWRHGRRRREGGLVTYQTLVVGKAINLVKVRDLRNAGRAAAVATQTFLSPGSVMRDRRWPAGGGCGRTGSRDIAGRRQQRLVAAKTRRVRPPRVIGWERSDLAALSVTDLAVR